MHGTAIGNSEMALPPDGFGQTDLFKKTHMMPVSHS